MRRRRMFGVLAVSCAAGIAHAQGAAVVLPLDIDQSQVPAAQRVLKVLQGDAVRLQVRSAQAGELHLHAYRLSVPVQAGQPAELAFKAHATGRFRLEWHAAQAAPTTAHGAPLAHLEVRPR